MNIHFLITTWPLNQDKNNSYWWQNSQQLNPINIITMYLQWDIIIISVLYITFFYQLNLKWHLHVPDWSRSECSCFPLSIQICPLMSIQCFHHVSNIVKCAVKCPSRFIQCPILACPLSVQSCSLLITVSIEKFRKDSWWWNIIKNSVKWLLVKQKCLHYKLSNHSREQECVKWSRDI